jgi:hypothetical protein
MVLTRAQVRARGDRERSIGHHPYMSFPRCAAKLRDGRPCNRTVVEGSEFCVHHDGLVDEHGAEVLKRGLLRRKEAQASWQPRLVAAESEIGTPSAGPAVTADPATVRPRLAEVAAESLDEISRTLLEAATGAAKKKWVNFECDCGRRKRVEIPVPDVRSRVAAIELLRREGLGRAPQAEEPSSPRIPRTPDEVEILSWAEMQDVAEVLREHEAVQVRERIAGLGEDQRRWLTEALAEIKS